MRSEEAGLSPAVVLWLMSWGLTSSGLPGRASPTGSSEPERLRTVSFWRPSENGRVVISSGLEVLLEALRRVRSAKLLRSLSADQGLFCCQATMRDPEWGFR